MTNIKELINHYIHFYEPDNSTSDFSIFCEWCRVNDDANALSRFIEDLTSLGDQEYDSYRLAAYGLVVAAGMIASAYELSVYGIDDKTFADYLNQLKKNKMKAPAYYKSIFLLDMSDELEKQVNRTFFRRSVKKLSLMHSDHVLNVVECLYHKEKEE